MDTSDFDSILVVFFYYMPKNITPDEKYNYPKN